MEAIQQLQVECLPRLPYSPSLAPGDYHVLGLFEEPQRGRKFTSDDKVKEAALTSTQDLPEETKWKQQKRGTERNATFDV